MKTPCSTKPRAQGVEIVDTIEFDDADGTFHAHVFHAWQSAAGREASLQRGGNIGDLLQPRLALEQIERGIGGGAGECIGHVGRPVHQRLFRIVRPEGLEHLARSQQSRRAASVPPVSAFDSVMMSGVTPACSQANIVPVRPKPVKISSKISRTSYLSASARRRVQHIRVMKFHAAGTLDQRLDNNCRRSFRRARVKQFVERCGSFVVIRQVDDVMCLAASPANAACMPASGSLTAMAPVVSP